MEPFKLLSVDRPSVLIEVGRTLLYKWIASLRKYCKNSTVAFQIGDVEIRSKVIKKLKKFPNFSEPVFFLEAVRF